MACLLPQFKCPSETLSTHSRTHQNHSTILLKCREHISLQTQCILTSTTTIPTTAVDIEKLRVTSLRGHSNSIEDDKPLMYIRPICPPAKENFVTNLVTGEESVIASAAAEAIALAKAAVEVAKEVTLMADRYPSTTESDNSFVNFPFEADFLCLKRALFTQAERICMKDHFMGVETRKDEHFRKPSFMKSDNLEVSNNRAVRSSRQTERTARRARAADKANVNVVSVKAGSSNRKKRAGLQDIDYSDPLRYLRGATCSSRLLTANEELKLSQGIQDLLKLEKLQEELAEGCGDEPTFSQWAAAAEVDQKILRRRLNYGIHCKEKMIKSNIRLVISIAKNYQGAGLNLQDLVQQGCRGLVRGAEKFDASKGFKFSTYAHWWIKQAVRKSLSDQSRTIRLPFHMVEATYRVREARKQLYSENGRHPDNEEVAKATGLSMKRLTAVLLTPKPPKSLDQKFGIMNLKPSEVIADPNAETTENVMMKQFMKQDLEKVLDSLNPREKKVIQGRFGLKDGRMRTLQEIGESMGVSRERIRQLESCAFRKLKNKKRLNYLKQYLVL